MKSVRMALALAGALSVLSVHRLPAISLDDIPLWTGSGTNRAALVVEWNSPELFNNTTAPAPVAAKTMVWGYRFNGSATGLQMLQAVLAADPKLYAVAIVYPFGTFVDGIGYNLGGNGVIGITDGTVTNLVTGGLLTTATVNPDAARPISSGDLFWSGLDGPNWNLWTELGDAGGYLASPNRGSSPAWDSASGIQGQWEYAFYGIDSLVLTNGSWIGYSVAAAGYDSDTNSVAYADFNNDEQAPPSPDGTYVAYVANPNDFGVQVVSTANLYPSAPYNNPAAVLNRPTLRFYDPYDGNVTNRVSIIDDPYNVAPDGSDVITEIASGGQMTVKLGHKVYADSSHPYGIDLIVYGNSFFTGISGTTGFVSDKTDLSVATLTSSSQYGHGTVISVSQDGTNWVALPAVSSLFPDNAYRWDGPNHIWTEETMNPTKPVNPFLYTNNFAGQIIAGVLDQFVGAAGGTGYSLAGTGLPWVQYVQVQPAAGTYTVIDAIAAVNPAVVGDALSIVPDNLGLGGMTLSFQDPNNLSRNQVSVACDSVGAPAKIGVVPLHEFSSFAPVSGAVSSAFQIQARPLIGTNAVAFTGAVGLAPAPGYAGDGHDLRVCEWNGTRWTSLPFWYDATNQQVLVTGLTNLSAFVVARINPPVLAIQPAVNGVAIQFTPVPNYPQVLERSPDLITWTPIATNVPACAQPVVLLDTNSPAAKSFYRVRVDIP